MVLLRIALRSALAHKGRMACSLMAVVLSVAFVVGSLVFSRTAAGAFEGLFAATTSDLSVRRAGNGILPVATAGRIAALPGVRTAVGDVKVDDAALVDPARNRPVGPHEGAPVTVGAWTADAARRLALTSGRPPAGGHEILLDADSAAASRIRTGDRLRVIARAGSHDFTVSGTARFTTVSPGAALALIEPATAQRILLGAAGFTSVEISGDGTRDAGRLEADIARDLGPGYRVLTAAEQRRQDITELHSLLGFLTYALMGFAGISLLISGFLIVNTFSMLVSQRTREYGLLRAIGAGHAQLSRALLLEAAALGVLGSVLGQPAGLGLAVLLTRLMTTVGMDLTDASLVLPAGVPAVSITVGVVVTVVAAWAPAHRVAKVSPLAAMRHHAVPPDRGAGRVLTGTALLLTAVGAVCLVQADAPADTTTGGLVLALGVLLTLTGSVAGGPVLATAAIRLLGAPAALFGVAGRLARRNAVRSPRRTGATAAALLIGMSLVTFAAVVTTSLTRSVDSQIDRSIGADYAVLTPHGALPQPAVAAVQAVPGLRHVTVEKEVEAVVLTPDGQRTPTPMVRACSPSVLHDLRLPVTAGTREGAFAGGISVDADFAAEHHLVPGSRLTVVYAGGRRQALPVALITTVGSGLFDGAFYTGLPTYTSAVPEAEQPGARRLFAQAASGADERRVMADLKRAVRPYPRLTVQDRAGYKKGVREQIGTVLYLVYALLALAITIALLGVVNTLALSVVERTREIGLLRAIGLSRRQLRRMIRVESVVISLFGAVLGCGLGLAWGVCTCRLLAPRGLDRIAVPLDAIASVVAASLLIGLVAALGPACRTGRMHVLSAVGTD
ncbi:ABC transporter permease [Streptomyces sp. NPDC001513]|uniref:ABC transporter permease n=1 Tax=Streptomyces sp. NPDC001513 TaxID=3364580 RepID=UPI00367BD977